MSFVMADIDNNWYDDIIAGASGQEALEVSGKIYIYFGAEVAAGAE